MSQPDTRRGIWLMIAVTFLFACMDALSSHLSRSTNVYMVVMIRYWFFAAFVIWLGMRGAGGLRAAARSRTPWLQVLRGILLVCEIVATVLGFVHLGLVATHAVFAVYPLMVAALSGPILRETVGWRRWLAIMIGFVGILVILRPGGTVFAPEAIYPLIGALIFAVYNLLNRYVARVDSAAVSFFYTGTVGAVLATVLGIPHWQPMVGTDWLWMGLLCLIAALAHWLMIRAYELAEASALQPFAYFQLVFIALIGFFVFREQVAPHVMLGGAIVVSAGLFTLIRGRRLARRRGRAG
ncbi:DMT family transporter [Paracoccus sp. p4-l81]|uniref:DMT family transporter n=1 Tax=Paracoccus sp. p4-l81 TaxID=3342806 RepID=UPI0035B82BBF